MKNPLTGLIVLLVLMSCTPKQKDNTKEKEHNLTSTPTNSTPFDLSKLTLTENLPQLMAELGIKSENAIDPQVTLWGHDKFTTTNDKVLRFGGADLSGSNEKNKNHVVFHYNTEKKTLAFYGLELFTQAQTDTLISILKKTGKPSFEDPGLRTGAIRFDENGNSVKQRADERDVRYRWNDKSTGVSYFLNETGLGNNLHTELIVLKPSEQSGKDYMSLKYLDMWK